MWERSCSNMSVTPASGLGWCYWAKKKMGKREYKRRKPKQDSLAKYHGWEDGQVCVTRERSLSLQKIEGIFMGKEDELKFQYGDGKCPRNRRPQQVEKHSHLVMDMFLDVVTPSFSKSAYRHWVKWFGFNFWLHLCMWPGTLVSSSAKRR